MKFFRFVFSIVVVFVLIVVYLPQPANEPEPVYADPYLCPDGRERVKIFDSGWLNISEPAVDENGHVWGRTISYGGNITPDRWRMEVWGCPMSCEEVPIT